jgi:hypothetical protein
MSNNGATVQTSSLKKNPKPTTVEVSASDPPPLELSTEEAPPEERPRRGRKKTAGKKRFPKPRKPKVAYTDEDARAVGVLVFQAREAGVDVEEYVDTLRRQVLAWDVMQAYHGG